MTLQSITTVNANGAVVDFDFAGIGRKGYFTALANGHPYKCRRWSNLDR